MSSRRQKLLSRVNWYLQSSLKHIIELITGNKFYHRGGRYRQVSLYTDPHPYTAWKLKSYKLFYSGFPNAECMIMCTYNLFSNDTLFDSTLKSYSRLICWDYGCVVYVSCAFHCIQFRFEDDNNIRNAIARYPVHYLLYSDVIMSAMASQVTSRLFAQLFVQAQIK